MNEVLLEFKLKEWLTTVNNYQFARKCGEPERLRLKDTKLREFDLHDVDLTEIDFANCDLSGADLSGTKLMGSSWKNCQFGLANLKDAQLQGATFGSGCNFEGATLNGCAVYRASFSASNFHNAKAVGANFDYVDFGNSRLTNMDLRRASLDNASNYLLDRTIVRDTGFSAHATALVDTSSNVYRSTFCLKSLTVNNVYFIFGGKGFCLPDTCVDRGCTRAGGRN